jgi:hypothetical protein
VRWPAARAVRMASLNRPMAARREALLGRASNGKVVP